MNRNDFQRLARIRLKEAKLLLQEGRADGAYYLSGIAIECALKACVARKTQRYDFPDRDAVNESWNHNPTKLVKAAGLEAELNKITSADPTFEKNWSVIKDWKVDSRYQFHLATKARDFYSAATMRTHEVMTWIRKHW